MYANNVVRFVQNLVKKGEVVLDFDDEVIRDTCLTHAGEVRNARVRELLGAPPPPTATAAVASSPQPRPEGAADAQT
jgi:NAD(P) transhydrogenase subunit alpha